MLGRSSRSRFEEEQLAAVVKEATAAHQFNRVTFLPEDEAVRKARWDGRLLTRGRWVDGIRRLSEALSVVPVRQPATKKPADWGLVMAQ